MLLSITSTTPDANDLGFLLHKHPDRVRSVKVSGGNAHVFYPESTSERCTATLLVEIDPIQLSRNRKGARWGPALEPYVNDRPYVASSMLCVALTKLYGTAISGTCETKPELVDKVLDLEIDVPVVAARGGADMVQRLFEPLGWTVETEPIQLDETFPSWGDSPYVSLRLTGQQRLKDALAHLLVMLPVLDERKHYWIGEEEIDKLMRRGGDWLAHHPDRELISRRYLPFGSLSREAISRLNDSGVDVGERDALQASGEQAYEKPLSLNQQRLDIVTAAVVAAGGGSVADLGCGEGRLLERLIVEPSVTKVLGIDVSIRELDRAEQRLHLDDMSERRRENITLAQGALTYTDARLDAYDIATAIEVIEHIDEERLDVFGQVVFGTASPQTVIITTPNSEYNVRFANLPEGEFRHGDHRFEWSRGEFSNWADAMCGSYGYEVSYAPIGPDDAEVGPPTQMATFRKVGR